MKLLENRNIILASKSPRRSKLMEEMGFKFVIKSMDVEETYPSDMNTKQVAEFLAIKKGKAFKSQLKKDDLVISADTIVHYGDKILGKPKDLGEASYMLKLLSSTSHKVLTGVSIYSIDKEISFTDESIVHFSHISQEAIEYYLKNQPPLDKAGAYGVQEWIGHNFVEKIIGSYTNIMGLPTEKLYQNLQRF